MEKLGINPLLLVAQIVNFVIILFLLKKYLYQPIIKILDDRKKKAEETERLNSEAVKKLEEIDNQGQKVSIDAKQEASKIIAQAKVQGQKEKEEITKKGKKELELLRKKLETEMEAEKKQMIKELKEQSAEMAVLVAEKVIHESLDEIKHRHLINSAIKDLEKVTWH